LAALACETPIALVSLVDEHRQWFKANIGLPGSCETPREHAFCALTIQSGDLLEVVDATADDRFRSNPLGVGEPHMRFYAGTPLTLPGGERIGSVSAIDRVPRQLDRRQRVMLTELAGMVSHALPLRDAGALSRAELALLDN
jgi:GAF domain-containing protein